MKAATERRAALPVPAQMVSEEEIAAARTSADRAKAELAAIEREVHRAHGALEQVGGGVARDRLRDALEAYELAERQEREVEADCEAWRLLLEQMKLADAEQASNLGQVLGPAVATRFEALTNKRYEGVQIAADLGTEGVLVRGAVRSTERISVGTREQLSTLYRLSLAEYLGSTVVLDDQLVQSDELRMEWFRALLRDKASQFQIVVFTLSAGRLSGRCGDAVPLRAAVTRLSPRAGPRGQSWSGGSAGLILLEELRAPCQMSIVVVSQLPKYRRKGRPCRLESLEKLAGAWPFAPPDCATRWHGPCSQCL